MQHVQPGLQVRRQEDEILFSFSDTFVEEHAVMLLTQERSDDLLLYTNMCRHMYSTNSYTRVCMSACGDMGNELVGRTEATEHVYRPAATVRPLPLEKLMGSLIECSMECSMDCSMDWASATSKARGQSDRMLDEMFDDCSMSGQRQQNLVVSSSTSLQTDVCRHVRKHVCGYVRKHVYRRVYRPAYRLVHRHVYRLEYEFLHRHVYRYVYGLVYAHVIGMCINMCVH